MIPHCVLSALCAWYVLVPVRIGDVMCVELCLSASKSHGTLQVSFAPGLYKIFDEVLANASDNCRRGVGTDRIEVTIDAERGTISVWNNGAGIPVQMHADEGVYVPELVMGHLLTGSNFDDSEVCLWAFACECV